MPETVPRDLEEICNYAGEKELAFIIPGFRWMSLLSDERARVQGTSLDTLAKHLEKTMSFGPGERDLVMLQHKFVIERADGNTETRTSTLELFGDIKKYSAISLSVGVTCGIATQLLLDGHKAFFTPGLLAPYVIDMCDATRDRVELEGVKMVEKVL